MLLLRKDPNKGEILDNFKPITLLSERMKILAKMFAKRLALVVEKLIENAQI